MNRIKRIIRIISLWLRIYVTEISYNYNVSEAYDEMMSYYIKSGIKQYVEINDFGKLMIMFNNGTIIDGWNNNKYYAWLSKCDFYYTDNTKSCFADVRLRKRTMVKLILMIEEFKKNQHK